MDYKLKNFLRQLLSYGGDGKFSKINHTLNERKRQKDVINTNLRTYVWQIQIMLNKLYKTKGTVSIFDRETASEKRVPLIHINTVFSDWDEFGLNKSIDLVIKFHFESTVHSERIEAIYSDEKIKFVIDEFTCDKIEEFCHVVESVVDKNLKLTN